MRARALGVALAREPPEPRPDDEQQAAGDRGRREQRPVRAGVPPRVRTSTAAPASSTVPTSRCRRRQKKNTPAAARAAATWTKPGKPEPVQGCDGTSSSSASPIAVRVPRLGARARRLGHQERRREVKQDPRTAASVKQREEQADECRVDLERARNSRGYARDHAVGAVAGRDRADVDHRG